MIVNRSHSRKTDAHEDRIAPDLLAQILATCDPFAPAGAHSDDPELRRRALLILRARFGVV